MKTKTITVCDAIYIDVACDRNDPVDIRCGGPAILGYSFFVSPDEDIDAVVKQIQGFIKKYRRPFIGINTSVRKNFDVDKLWTIDSIEKCIKEFAI